MLLDAAPAPCHGAGMLELGELTKRITEGSLDTVVVAFPDMQGRPVGKRVTGRFFLDHVLEHGIEVCDYLLAVDVDMEPLAGYRFTNWETGYGDVVALPDLSTLRLLPWLEGSAHGGVRPGAHPGRPRRGLPEKDPAPSDRTRRARSASTSGARPSSSSTCSARPSRRRLHRGGVICTRTCRPSRTTSCCRRRARSTCCVGSATRCWRPASPSSSPRARRAGPARGQRHLRARHGGRRPAPRLQERREGDRRPVRPVRVVHGQVVDRRGRARRATSTPACGTPSPAPR